MPFRINRSTAWIQLDWCAVGKIVMALEWRARQKNAWWVKPSRHWNGALGKNKGARRTTVVPQCASQTSPAEAHACVHTTYNLQCILSTFRWPPEEGEHRQLHLVVPEVHGGVVHYRPAGAVRSPVSAPEVAVEEGRLDFQALEESFAVFLEVFFSSEGEAKRQVKSRGGRNARRRGHTGLCRAR